MGEGFQVRSIDVSDALVDTRVPLLCLPKHLIEELGLSQFRMRRLRSRAGTVDYKVYAAVRLTIQGRDCSQDVAEVRDDCPVLIGQIPLHALDFVIDTQGQRLIGNPDHKGEHMIDMF
jgi:predicted aspartyl protease